MPIFLYSLYILFIYLSAKPGRQHYIGPDEGVHWPLGSRALALPKEDEDDADGVV